MVNSFNLPKQLATADLNETRAYKEFKAMNKEFKL